MSPAERNLRFGWWALLVFLLGGLLLESFHGFKASWYVSVGAEPRRLMWRLAHAHGTLVALINVVFGVTFGLTGLRHRVAPAWIRRASPCLISAGILLPGGFFLGGIGVQGGDPGPGVLVVPVGGLLLAAGVAFAALALRPGVSEPTEQAAKAGSRRAGGVS